MSITMDVSQVVGEIVLPGGPSLWPMWRDPRP